MRERKTVLLFLLLLLAVFLTYRSSLGNEFVWDDEYKIVHNPHLKTFKSLPLFFTKSVWQVTSRPVHSDLYRPLFMGSYWIDYQLWGLNSFGFHLTHLTLYLLNVALLFSLLLIAFGDAWIAFLATGIFSMHPVQSETVNWLGGRSDLLCLFFLFLTAGILLRFREGGMNHGRRIGMQVIVILTYLCALLSKETAVGFLVAAYFISGWRSVVPLLGSVGIYWGLRSHALGDSYAVLRIVPSLPEFPLSLGVITEYIKKFCYPTGLSIANPFEFQPVLAVTIGAILVVTCLLARRVNGFIPGILVFVGFMLPAALFVPRSGILSDRYLTIPMVGLVIAISALLKRMPRAFLAAPFLAVLLLSYSTLQQNQSWRTGRSLWSKVIKERPAYFHGYFNYAIYLDRAGFKKEAAAAYEKALEIDPKNFETLNDLGAVLGDLKLYEKAIDRFREAQALRPHDVVSFKNERLAREALKREALQHSR